MLADICAKILSRDYVDRQAIFHARTATDTDNHPLYF
jgi:hypothetical protein